MKKLIVAVSVVMTAAWLLMACSGSNNSNTNGNCAAYPNGYNPSVYGGTPGSPYGGAYGSPYGAYGSPYGAYGNSPYGNSAYTNPCTAGLSPYYNPAGQYPYNGAYNSNMMPLYSVSSGASYFAPYSMQNQFLPYATLTNYGGFYWYYIP